MKKKKYKENLPRAQTMHLFVGIIVVVVVVVVVAMVVVVVAVMVEVSGQG